MTKIIDFAFTGIPASSLEYLNDLRQENRALIVKHDDPAISVANKVAEAGLDHVIVVGNQDNILGVVVKSYIDDQLLSKSLQMSRDLSQGILKLAQGPGVRQFELPTRVRPQLFYCTKGKHFTSEDPCSIHP